MVNAFDPDLAPCHSRVVATRRETRSQRKLENTDFVIGFISLVLDIDWKIISSLVFGNPEVYNVCSCVPVFKRENPALVVGHLHFKGQAARRCGRTDFYWQIHRAEIRPRLAGKPHRTERLGNPDDEVFLIEVVISPVRRQRSSKADAVRLNDIQIQRQFCRLVCKTPSRRKTRSGPVRSLPQGQGDGIIVGVVVFSEDINHEDGLAVRFGGNRETSPLRRDGHPAWIARGQRQSYPLRRSFCVSSSLAYRIQIQAQGSQSGAFRQPFRIVRSEGDFTFCIAVIIDNRESVPVCVN